MQTQSASDLALARRVAESTHEPLLVLDEEPRVRAARPSLCRTFAGGPEATSRIVGAIDGPWFEVERMAEGG